MKGEIDNCPPELAFQCPKSWDELDETKWEKIRLCQICDRRVFACDSYQEEREHAAKGHCIARRYAEMMVLGEPHVPEIEKPKRKPRWKKK